MLELYLKERKLDFELNLKYCAAYGEELYFLTVDEMNLPENLYSFNMRNRKVTKFPEFNYPKVRGMISHPMITEYDYSIGKDDGHIHVVMKSSDEFGEAIFKLYELCENEWKIIYPDSTSAEFFITGLFNIYKNNSLNVWLLSNSYKCNGLSSIKARDGLRFVLNVQQQQLSKEDSTIEFVPYVPPVAPKFVNVNKDAKVRKCYFPFDKDGIVERKCYFPFPVLNSFLCVYDEYAVVFTDNMKCYETTLKSSLTGLRAQKMFERIHPMTI